MFNQDFIMRQIQQMTQVLNRILTQVLKLKSVEDQTQTMNFLDVELMQELGFDLDEILQISDEEDLVSFKGKSGFNNENLNILADILFEVADQNFEDPDHHAKSLQFFSQSLRMYEFLEKDEKTYSIDRNLKISKIKDLLEL